MKTRLQPGLPPVLASEDRLADVDLMCCREVSELPREEGWIYEMKYEGCRVLAVKRDGKVQLTTRNHRPLGAMFPQVEAAVMNLNCSNVVLDGLLVAVDARGRVLGCPLAMMQAGRVSTRLQLKVMDLLELDGAYVQGLPVHLRKQRLSRVVSAADSVCVLMEELTGDVAAMMVRARDGGHAGVVAKQVDSSYEEGRRSGTWVKCLVRHQKILERPKTKVRSTRLHPGVEISEERRRKAA